MFVHFTKNNIFGIFKYNKLKVCLFVLKKLLVILFLTSGLFGLAQTKTNKAIPGSEKSVKKKYSSSTVNIPLDTLKHNTCLDKQFSIVFYIVLDTILPSSPNYPGIGAATPSNIANLMAEINDAFKPICVSFVNCTTIYIPNFSYGKSWTKNTIEPQVTAQYYTGSTINFYLVDTVASGDGNNEWEGYTYDPSVANLGAAKKDLIVLDKYKVPQAFGGVTLHLLGHFFGLPHTFDEVMLPPKPPASPPPPSAIVSQEFADGSNCYDHGDRFCDTEADPNDFIINADGMGNFYLRPLDNYMSYYSQRSRFTQEQYNWMAHIIMTSRLYLH